MPVFVFYRKAETRSRIMPEKTPQKFDTVMSRRSIFICREDL